MDLFGDAFDGFSPAPVKSYGRMRAKMLPKEDHFDRARPRPNMNVDIVRCLILLPTIHDFPSALQYISDEFAGFVK